MAKTSEIFIREYSKESCLIGGFIVCRTPREFQLSTHTIALPWQALAEIIQRLIA